MDDQGPYSRLRQVFSPRAFTLDGVVLDSDMWGKLDLIAQVKNFALMVGLEPSPNYMRCSRQEDAVTLYSLYAAPGTSLSECVERYFFLEEGQTIDKVYPEGVRVQSLTERLEDVERLYLGRGFDVCRRVNTDFNLHDGAGCDITPELLNSGYHDQVRVVLHEDWHHTYNRWHPGRMLCSAINEAAAEILGFAGAVEFGRLVGEDGSRFCRTAEERYEKAKENAVVFNSTYEALDDLYSSALTDEQKLRRRKSLFRRIKRLGYRPNNATIMDMRPYTKHFPLFAEAYEQLGSVKCFVNLMRNCPIDEGRAVKFIRDFVEREGVEMVVELPAG